MSLTPGTTTLIRKVLEECQLIQQYDDNDMGSWWYIEMPILVSEKLRRYGEKAAEFYLLYSLIVKGE